MSIKQQHKAIAEMNRIQILDELRKHAHSSWYQNLGQNSTAALRALLVYYTSEEAEQNDGEVFGVGAIVHASGLTIAK